MPVPGKVALEETAARWGLDGIRPFLHLAGTAWRRVAKSRRLLEPKGTHPSSTGPPTPSHHCWEWRSEAQAIGPGLRGQGGEQKLSATPRLCVFAGNYHHIPTARCVTEHSVHHYLGANVFCDPTFRREAIQTVCNIPLQSQENRHYCPSRMCARVWKVF